MSIFFHMTSGKTFATFITSISGECHYCLLFYGYNNLNTIYLCDDVFYLYIENV